MRFILVDILHLFVIFMMGSFVILSVVAATGEFDHWTARYSKRKSKRSLRYDRSKRIDVQQDTYEGLTTLQKKEAIITRMRERALQSA